MTLRHWVTCSCTSCVEVCRGRASRLTRWRSATRRLVTQSERRLSRCCVRTFQVRPSQLYFTLAILWTHGPSSFFSAPLLSLLFSGHMCLLSVFSTSVRAYSSMSSSFLEYLPVLRVSFTRLCSKVIVLLQNLVNYFSFITKLCGFVKITYI